jgi:hypothetical protein
LNKYGTANAAIAPAIAPAGTAGYAGSAIGYIDMLALVNIHN